MDHVKNLYSYFRTVNSKKSININKKLDDDYTLLRSVIYLLVENMVLNGEPYINNLIAMY